MVGALGRARTAIPPCVACVNLCSLPRGGYRQTERRVRGWRAWARPHGDSAVRRLCESLCPLYWRGGYRQTERGVRGWRAWARRLSVNPTLPSTARQFCRAQRTPTAKCPRTTFSPLLPTLYKKIFVVHSCPFVVLPSSPCSLLTISCVSWFHSTQATRGGTAARARPSAPTTHYFLPSPPYSLLWHRNTFLSATYLQKPRLNSVFLLTDNHLGTLRSLL